MANKKTANQKEIHARMLWMDNSSSICSIHNNRFHPCQFHMRLIKLTEPSHPHPTACHMLSHAAAMMMMMMHYLCLCSWVALGHGCLDLSMPASVTMEIGVNLRDGALPGDLTDVEEGRRGRTGRRAQWARWQTYHLVKQGSFTITS